LLKFGVKILIFVEKNIILFAGNFFNDELGYFVGKNVLHFRNNYSIFA